MSRVKFTSPVSPIRQRAKAAGDDGEVITVIEGLNNKTRIHCTPNGLSLKAVLDKAAQDINAGRGFIEKNGNFRSVVYRRTANGETQQVGPANLDDVILPGERLSIETRKNNAS